MDSETEFSTLRQLEAVIAQADQLHCPRLRKVILIDPNAVIRTRQGIIQMNLRCVQQYAAKSWVLRLRRAFGVR